MGAAGSCDTLSLKERATGHGPRAAGGWRAGGVFQGRSLTLGALPPPSSSRSFTVFLGQAWTVGILQFGEKIMPISYLQGISGRPPLSPERPEVDISIAVCFTSLWTSLPSSRPSLRPTHVVCAEAQASPWHMSPSPPAAPQCTPSLWKTLVTVLRACLRPLLALWFFLHRAPCTILLQGASDDVTPLPDILRGVQFP